MTDLFCSAQQADLVLRGTITGKDRESYVEVPFEVGASVVRVTVDFSYTGRDQHTTIDLGLFDGERFRGWSGGNKSWFTVSETDATPSYLPGPIRPGTWKLILGVPSIGDGVKSEYVATIHLQRSGEAPAASTFSRAPLRAGAAWYRGDLHMHDAHSDGSCLSQSGAKVPCPLYKTVEAATARGLDFIAISDHNTISHYDAMRELQPYFDRLLLIPGREITTFEGHANVYGTTEFIDFRLEKGHVSIDDIQRQTEKLHGMFSINHPGLPSGSACMGCGWAAKDTDYSRVGAVEAINGGTLDGPMSGVAFWQEKLNRGFRLTGVGGSDNHNATMDPQAHSAVGYPATVVYAAELSERAILEGIRTGHVFVDVQGTRDRGIEFTAQADGKTVMMGDAIAPVAGANVHLVLTMNGLEGAHAEVIRDGEVTTLLDASVVKEHTETREFDYEADGKRHWVRVNVRAADGALLILGNPIYLNL
ncbi:CehA/McbA family metallohydrolase [Edaphobacter bradus]|uniref:CehA/McbA family metallohydrolase n=1 Tax=Edaphobacter bradus TaxID=2259016 RepID=UPI0021E0E4E4|nr:CehA/McbA family metallohydrolase [Edaphobacter bradus]